MLDDATEAFTSIEGVSEDLANALVEQGFLSFDDLSVIELDDLVALAGGELTEEQALKITDRAEELALELERQEKERRESERGQNPRERRRAFARAPRKDCTGLSWMETFGCSKTRTHKPLALYAVCKPGRIF